MTQPGLTGVLVQDYRNQFDKFLGVVQQGLLGVLEDEELRNFLVAYCREKNENIARECEIFYLCLLYYKQLDSAAKDYAEGLSAQYGGSAVDFTHYNNQRFHLDQPLTKSEADAWGNILYERPQEMLTSLKVDVEQYLQSPATQSVEDQLANPVRLTEVNESANPVRLIEVNDEFIYTSGTTITPQDEDKDKDKDAQVFLWGSHESYPSYSASTDAPQETLDPSRWSITLKHCGAFRGEQHSLSELKIRDSLKRGSRETFNALMGDSYAYASGAFSKNWEVKLIYRKTWNIEIDTSQIENTLIRELNKKIWESMTGRSSPRECFVYEPFLMFQPSENDDLRLLYDLLVLIKPEGKGTFDKKLLTQEVVFTKGDRQFLQDYLRDYIYERDPKRKVREVIRKKG